MKKQLHPGVKVSYRLFSLFFFIFIGIFVMVFGSEFIDWVVLLVIYIVLAVLITEIYARLTYNNWLYEFTDEQLRLERGIIWKRYSNIPYERIQNVDITRGIIARLFGFSTVMIQTAGFSYSPNHAMMAEGYIPGVSKEEAEHIREFVVKKVTKKGRKQGL